MEVRPDFRRFRQALLCQGEADRVPLYEGSIHNDIKSGFLGRKVRTLADEVEFLAKAGYDYFSITMGIRLMLRREYALAGQVPLGPADPLLRPHRERYSPFTEEEKERYWAEESKGKITSMAEFEAFPWPKVEDFSLAVLDDAAKLLAPGMKLVASIGWVYSATWMLMGFETFCMSLVENPELVKRVFDQVGSTQLGVTKRVVEHPAIGALVMSDDFAYTEGLLLSPKVIRQYVWPWYEQINGVAKAHDLPVILHSDGKLWEILEDIISVGFSGLHPVEPKAMNIVELKEKVKGRLCLLGNIDLGYTLTRGTPEEVAIEVKERLRTVGPGGGYCLGSANSVPEYVPLANYRAMRDTALQYGTYPIRI